MTSEREGRQPFLVLAGVSRHFGATRALDGADLKIAPGEVHALVGENGAGKSTLIKLLSGLHQPGGGAIVIDGAATSIAGPLAAEALGFRFIHQELNLVPHFDTVGNAWIGRRHPHKGPFIDRAAMRARVAAVAARIAPDLPLDRPAARLTPGQRQMAEIVRALMTDARLVVMDEPTSSLSEAEAERLHAVVRQLAASGTAVLFISHRLDEVMALADGYTVLRGGRTVGAGRVKDIDRAGLVRLMSGGSALAEALPKAALRVASSRDVALSADIAFGPAGGRAMIEIGAGEIVGLYGLVGAGRSALLKALWGALPVTGSVRLAGRPLAGGPAGRIAMGAVYVPEDRRREGFAGALSIADNLALAHLADFRRAPRLPLPARGRIRAFARDVGARLRLVAASLERSPLTLSGGNQQKLLFGRWLGRPIRLALIDEPTRGVDVGAKAEIHDEIRRISASGAAVIAATSDIEELMALSDRVLVMNGGRIVADLSGAVLTREAVVAAAFGHAPRSHPHQPNQTAAVA
ncbi:MAG TPA: sugar ABC transporter ATP-binding protein [Kaistia sp.]|nr:sugar ABC transporter ATP-binding protein [Kaistia sp.]